MSDDRELNHEYDGIKEYDNPLPNWWLVTFFATIIFAFIYWMHYEIAGGPTLDQELAVAMKEIETRQAHAPKELTTDEVYAEIAADQGRLQAAAGNFQAKCAACHGPKLEGMIGPNLTDSFWLHGDGSYHEIAVVIREGIPEKGMPPWQELMKESEIAELTAYIHSMKGSNPPNAKAPEGAEVK
ncbi:MAG: c-type cytochrome [Bdellovibrionaceae bacterium]|nr:c-type cytochrome [Pseudobdellovibrionaceae bacterium]